jgi:hypothetical protein
MFPHEKYPVIARGLLAKTQAGQAAWKQVVDEPHEFVLALPQSRIYVHFISPVAEVDRIELQLSRKDGVPAGTWIVEEGDEAWGLASELYATVERSVIGWDKVLEDVEQFLKSDRVPS